MPVPLTRIAIRDCPKPPPITEERIKDTRAANVADSAMSVMAGLAPLWRDHDYKSNATPCANGRVDP